MFSYILFEILCSTFRRVNKNSLLTESVDIYPPQWYVYSDVCIVCVPYHQITGCLFFPQAMRLNSSPTLKYKLTALFLFTYYFLKHIYKIHFYSNSIKTLQTKFYFTSPCFKMIINDSRIVCLVRGCVCEGDKHKEFNFPCVVA